MALLLFIVILFVLVLAHEFGHYIVAKRAGVKVEEFGFGYPPRAVKLFKHGETLFTLNWLPFGGFVKIYGEDPTEENTNGQEKSRSLVNKPKYTQAFVLVAGVLMNFLLAWFLFGASFVAGLPVATEKTTDLVYIKGAKLTIMHVDPQSPAQVAGLHVGDVITKLVTKKDTLENPNAESVSMFVQNHGRDPITFSLSTKVGERNVTVTPKLSEKEGRPLVGISMQTIGTLKLPIHKALIKGFTISLSTTRDIIVSISKLIVGRENVNDVSGPVGIVHIVGDSYKFGWAQLMSLTAVISLNLAVINLIPFPALDGGRLLFVGIEAITRKKINPKVANWLNTIGFGILILLMIFVTYHDIVKLIAK